MIWYIGIGLIFYYVVKNGRKRAKATLGLRGEIQ